jgi:hypothetical protein
MSTATEQFVADFCAPFLLSMKALLSFDDTPRLGCFVMDTEHLIWWKDGFFAVCDPDAHADAVAQKLRNLLVLTSVFDNQAAASI